MSLSTAKEIIYQKRRPRWELGDERLLRTKSIDWEYEKELRVLVKLADVERVEQVGDLYFRLFDDDLRLREVILGEYSGTILSKEAIENLVDDSYIYVFRSRVARTEFQVNPDGRHQSGFPFLERKRLC